MTKPPTGTLTLVFTDIEGSTRLADELGERWPAVIGDHNRLLRAAFATHNGVEVDRRGDEFFVVFRQATEAAAAAAAAQRALFEHVWPDGAEVRVRMGLHTGEPVVSQEGYLGVDVHKAARICSAAHGGQVLLSRATRQLVEVAARDLGEFRLKDLTAPERLYQLEVDGIPSNFPPPHSLRAMNLPTQPMPLIGRRADISAGLTLLRSEVRLVTLTGAGGSGKTHLALQIAADLSHEFGDGVYWVPLAPVSDPATVEDAIATTVGAPVESGALVRYLRDRELLLLIDNFEQVLPAAPLIREILVAAPRVKVLVTSRSPLHISDEHELPVLPLAPNDALELFVERARAVRPTFEPGEAVLEICRRLDYMPLALELAAARMKHVTATDLLTRLGRSLDILTGGARDLPERQQTLRATIDWSYRLLSPEEQRLFARLAVFAGRATLDRIEEVCAVDGDGGPDVIDAVSSLVDKSLLRWFVHPGEPAHYFMLETIREFARERLAERGEETMLHRRHRDTFLRLAERLNPIDWVSAMLEIGPERNNLRAALRWSLDADGESDETLRLAFVLWRYWLETGAVTEGRGWLDAALALTRTTDRELHARALDAAAFLTAQNGDLDRAVRMSEDALAIARTLPDAPRVLAWCLYRRGSIDVDRGRLDEALIPFGEAAELFRREQWPLALAWAQIELSRVALLQGRLDDARRGFEEIIEAERHDVEQIAFAYAQVLLGSTLGVAGEVERGLAYLERGLALLTERNAQFTLAIAYLHVAPVFHIAGDRARERNAVSQALQRCRDGGIVPRGSACLEGAARIAADTGDHAAAARLWGAADQICKELGIVRNPLRLRLRELLERRAREGLGEEVYVQAFDAGRTLSLAEAFELGLKVIETVEEV